VILMEDATPPAGVHYRRSDADKPSAATGLTTGRNYVCRCFKSAEWMISVSAPGTLTGVLAACDACASEYRTEPALLMVAAMRLRDCAVDFRLVPQVVPL
jgi:hypothetical protein